MSEPKPGEVITSTLEQDDDQGRKISKVVMELYGYEDRSSSNQVTQGFAAAILETIKAFDAAAQKGGGTPGRK